MALRRLWVLAVVAVTAGCPGSGPGGALGARCTDTAPCEALYTCWQGSCTYPDLATPDAGGGGSGGSSGGAGGSAGAGGAGGVGGGTNCGPCNTPPTQCHGQGSCVNGQCEYPFVEGASCDDGNACTVADACHAGGCSGTAKVCDTPPGSVCTSSTTVLSYDATGSCQAGLCVYSSHSLACSGGGCRNNACVNDVCGSVTCNTPPSICFANTGTCSGSGQCSYAFQDLVSCDDGDACTVNDSCSSGVCQGAPKFCTAPPADSCFDANTVRAYARVGSCAAGTCGYTSSLISCAHGCSGGACVGSGWAVSPSGTTLDLSAVWGSGPNAVWAGGSYGTLLFFNGTSWQARVSGTTESFSSLSGTSATDVFATTFGGSTAGLRHFDGSIWTALAVQPAGSPSSSSLSCVGAVGPNEAVAAIAAERLVNPANPSGAWKTVRALMHVWKTGTTWNAVELGSFDLSSGSSYDSCSVTVLGANDYVVSGMRWNGTAFVSLGTTAPDSYPVYVASPTAAVGVNGGSIASVLSGTTWAQVNVGFQANGVHGSSASRVFIAGGTGPYSGPYSPRISLWDGLGASALSMPAAATDQGYLNAVFAVPGGDVFAVGSGGLILKGP